MPSKPEDTLKPDNNLSLPVRTTRRRLLQLGSSAGMGLAIALVNKDLWHNSSQASPLPTFEFQTVTVDSTGQIIDRHPRQAEFFTENLGNDLNLDMVKIPGGNFQMGSPTTEAEREENESPQHLVNISSFFMGKYTVTQEQWQAIMGNNPSEFKGAKLPVEGVRWDQPMEFCQRLSQKTGKNYRLPSEAEWEYACRAGTTTPFYFGETITPELANYGRNHEQTTNVGSFPPNAFGLYDMHGNVWEWCSDHVHVNYDGAPTDGSSWESSTMNDYRIFKGGTWALNNRKCRSASRQWNNDFFVSQSIGLRVVVFT